ncbi:50S ribosomal protein L3 [Salsuginibacillus kocurii]|uniref:50S ribosomal protein L3 n=1 Tax=Salsuginibacillus kocurii TaxID=427078 RepID=UPI0003715A73|nr:50S ribosomal protein L3 [Salsuginibacillus kocurii]
MAKGILGKKLGMTQIFDENGEVVPVTVIEAEPNVVLQTKNQETDGYEAVQLGVADKKQSRSNKPEQGHAEKVGATPKRYIREIRDANVTDYEAGQEVKVDTFDAGDFVDVVGTSKGKGFQGAIKRHNQTRGPMSHGSRFHRRPGSMGVMGHYTVKKGKKLPGRMGGKQVTVQNLEIVKVDGERNLLLIKGNVPGPKKSFVTVKSTIKAN